MGRLRATQFFLLILTGLFLAGSLPGQSNPEPALKINKSVQQTDTLVYRLAPDQSRFLAHVDAGGLLSPFAHHHTIDLGGYSGQVQVVSETGIPINIHLIIPADSLVVIDKEHRKDIPKIQQTMRQDVLEVRNFPQIEFRSSGITAVEKKGSAYRLEISGNLTLHGETHPLAFSCEVRRFEHALRANGEFSILQTDYGMKPVSLFGGLVKVKDRVKISFNMLAQ